MPSTWLEVMPYLRQCAPPELKARFPPIEQICWLEGSGAYSRPKAAAARLTARLMIPGSTTAVPASGSSLITRLSRLSAMTIPSRIGSDPPDSEVPLPRATNGVPVA